MSLRLFFYLMCFLSWASLARATVDWDEENQLKEFAYPEIERTLEIMRSGPKFAEKCIEPAQHNCSFDSFCRAFPDRTKSIYLYENEEGRRIPNTALVGIYNTLASCGKGFEFPTLSEDPFLYPQKLLDKQNRDKWEKEKPRLEKLYLETKNRLIDILKSRKDGQNDSAIDNMIQRIQTVKLQIPDEKIFADLAGQGCEFPNAFYYPSLHSFTVCPQFGNFPDASVMSTMAHELGHAIDPCHCAQDLVKTSEGYVTDYAFDGKLLAIKENVPGEKVLSGLMGSKNPLSSVVKCLQGSASIGVKVITASEVKAKIVAEGKRDRNPEIVAFGNSIPDLYPRYGACDLIAGNSYLTESFADWISGEVLAHKLKDIPEANKAKQFALESQGMFFGAACPGVMSAIQAKAHETMGTSGPSCGRAFQDYETLSELSSEHPVPAKRITKIIYAQPEIQKALGCKAEKFKGCQ